MTAGAAGIAAGGTDPSRAAFVQLVWVLTRANLKTRYRRTIAGFAWVVLNPLLMYGAQAVIFTSVLRVPVDNYGLFLLSGLIPWIFLAQTLDMCTGIFVASGKLLKSYPVHPLVYLLAQLIDNLFNFVAAFLIILLPVWIFGHADLRGLVLLPLAIAALAFGVFSLSWLLATTQVFLRDTRFVVSFAMSIAYFLTPIFYPIEFVPGSVRWLCLLNPFYLWIRPFRESIYRLDLAAFAWSLAASIGVGLACLVVARLVWTRRRNALYFNL